MIALVVASVLEISSRRLLVKTNTRKKKCLSVITDLFGGVLLVAAVTYDDVRALASEARHDALETTFFAWAKQKPVIK